MAISESVKALEEGVKAFGEKAGKDKAINNIYDFFTGGFRSMAGEIKAGKGLSEAAKTAYMDGKNFKVGAIAGSYLTAATGYRMLSGGGLYRDKNGNTDIVGIPFI